MTRLRILMPSGTLDETLPEHLKKLGFTFIEPSSSRKYDFRIIHEGLGLTFDALYVNHRDIPAHIHEGFVAQAAFVGTDTFLEVNRRWAKQLVEFSTVDESWRIVVLAPVASEIRQVSDVPVDSIIYSEYPRLTKAFFAKFDIPVRVKLLHGKSEGVANVTRSLAVCVADSGGTAIENGLLELEPPILKFGVSFIVNSKAFDDVSIREPVCAINEILAA